LGNTIALPKFMHICFYIDYQLLRLGKSGYRAIMTNLTNTADFLAESIAAIGGGEKFVLMSKTGGDGLPLVAWRLKNEEVYDGMTSVFRDVLQLMPNI
jgi:glutamate/tyrosine decarboxylase-like PLP-dependent enzyme